jgi:D-glycero-D-manno-heptose 1,7-bisphosphate phosphatase
MLDRDGTLIDVIRDEETGTIGVAFHPDQIRFLPGAIEGARLLANAGFNLAIVTNQPAAAKGQFSRAAIERTNAAVVALLKREGVPVSRVAVCLHHPTGCPGGDASLILDCSCRKPKPGLLTDSLGFLGADARSAWMIGDSLDDVRAGQAAGVRTGLIYDTRRCELCPLRDAGQTRADLQGPTILAVATQILALA